MIDRRFPWIKFPDNPTIGDQLVVRSKVMPVFVTWEYRADGWHELRCD